MTDQRSQLELPGEESITSDDFYSRQTTKEILATTALYGPWKPDGTFDWESYENLVRTVMRSGSVPATNVDTTWAIYNNWHLTKELIWRTAEIALQEQQHIAEDRPLMVAGLNTNSMDIEAGQIAPALRDQLKEIDAGFRKRRMNRIRYMPVPDRRLYHAPSRVKISIHREIGRVIGEFTQFGMVFFELDIGIKGFGSNYSPREIESILAETPEIQEYKSAIISKKMNLAYPYDMRADLLRIRIIESVAADRVQFSTGNDWFISLARCGKHIKNFGYLLGASQMSPNLFKRWRDAVMQHNPEGLALEHDLQAAAKDFWTPGNVGIYRHYLAIFLAMTGIISHPLPHPNCEPRYRVKPEDYFVSLKHAVRLGLVPPEEIQSIVRNLIPGCADWTEDAIRRRVEWLG
ncbi:hypothetical protein JXJ21_11430 [candidate division KSB1 bacterium]|nr:hypothetical protein [candidate division KSB1 bacterium]